MEATAPPYKIEDIYKFLDRHGISEELHPDYDLLVDGGIYGDDFWEMIELYSKKFHVDVSGFLWYFHSPEEGSFSPGGMFFKSPDERVERIPVTPQMLLDFANLGKWDIKYPEHTLPKRRWDLFVNKIIIFGFLAFLALAFLLNYCVSE